MWIGFSWCASCRWASNVMAAMYSVEWFWHSYNFIDKVKYYQTWPKFHCSLTPRGLVILHLYRLWWLPTIACFLSLVIQTKKDVYLAFFKISFDVFDVFFNIGSTQRFQLIFYVDQPIAHRLSLLAPFGNRARLSFFQNFDATIEPVQNRKRDVFNNKTLLVLYTQKKQGSS